MGIRENFKYVYPLYWIYYKLKYELPYMIHGKNADISAVTRKYKAVFGREINLNHPQTLNEKLNWLKINVHDPRQTICADKFRARKVWKKYGKNGLIPLLFQTYNWRDITMDVIPDEPCIIKSNSGSGNYEIIRHKDRVNIRLLRARCRRWMLENHYYMTQEWQYKNIRRCIIIEKLLTDTDGKIPNDYKLHFFNGELKFIYCSIDREGENFRSIYTPEWVRIDCEWVAKTDHKGFVGKNIKKPETFMRMLKIGRDIAKHFHYVRVDFYEVNGALYYGEITFHHGSGFDTFEPSEWDITFGKELRLDM